MRGVRLRNWLALAGSRLLYQSNKHCVVDCFTGDSYRGVAYSILCGLHLLAFRIECALSRCRICAPFCPSVGHVRLARRLRCGASAIAANRSLGVVVRSQPDRNLYWPVSMVIARHTSPEVCSECFWPRWRRGSFASADWLGSSTPISSWRIESKS